MRVKDYRFRDGSRLPQKQAKAAGKHLARLHNDHGSLTAELVLDDAASKSSPLHSMFDWDDSRAARQYRLHQARTLIRDVIVVYETAPNRTSTMHAYVKLRSADERPKTPYLAMPHVLTDADLRARLLRQALADIEEWKERYKSLNELASVFAAIAAVKAKAMGVRRKNGRKRAAS